MTLLNTVLKEAYHALCASGLLIYFQIIKHLEMAIHRLNTRLRGASRIRVTPGQVDQLAAVLSRPAKVPRPHEIAYSVLSLESMRWRLC